MKTLSDGWKKEVFELPAILTHLCPYLIIQIEAVGFLVLRLNKQNAGAILTLIGFHLLKIGALQIEAVFTRSVHQLRSAALKRLGQTFPHLAHFLKGQTRWHACFDFLCCPSLHSFCDEWIKSKGIRGAHQVVSALLERVLLRSFVQKDWGDMQARLCT